MKNIVKGAITSLAILGLGVFGGSSAIAASDKPLIPDGSVLAIAFNSENLVARLEASLGSAAYSTLKEYFFGEILKSGGEFFKDAGIEDLDIEWGIFTSKMIEFDTFGNPKGMPDFAIVLKADHDTAKLLDTIERYMKEKASPDKPVVRKGTYRGARYFYVDDSTKNSSQGLNIPFAATSLDDELYIAASSKKFLKKMITLYATGNGNSNRFGDLFFSEKTVLVAKAVDFGSNLSKTPFVDSLSKIDEQIPGGSDIVKGIKDIKFEIASFSGGKIGVTAIIAEMASEEHAAIIKRALEEKFAEQKEMMNSLIAQNPESAENAGIKIIMGIIKGIEIKSEGARLSIVLQGEADFISLFALGYLSQMR